MHRYIMPKKKKTKQKGYSLISILFGSSECAVDTIDNYR